MGAAIVISSFMFQWRTIIFIWVWLAQKERKKWVATQHTFPSSIPICLSPFHPSFTFSLSLFYPSFSLTSTNLFSFIWVFYYRAYIRLDTAIFKSPSIKLQGTQLVSLTTLALHNYLLFCTKLQPFSKTLEKCEQRNLKHQQYIKGLIKVSRYATTP